MVHIFHYNLVGGKKLRHGQVGTVYVNWIVMCPGETGVFDGDFSFTTGHLHEIGKSGAGTSATGFGFESHIAVSDVFGHLADDAEVTQEIQV